MRTLKFDPKLRGLPVAVLINEKPYRVHPLSRIQGAHPNTWWCFIVGAASEEIGSTDFLELSPVEFESATEAFAAMIDGLEVTDAGQSSHADAVVEALISAKLVGING